MVFLQQLHVSFAGGKTREKIFERPEFSDRVHVLKDDR